MKIFTLSLGFTLLSTFMQAQNGTGIDAIIVEKYYVANAADSLNADNQGAVVPLVSGKSITYRVYLDMAAGYKFSLLKGNATHPLIIKTTTAFYNDPNNGVEIGAQSISATNIKKNTVLIDSWLTTGGVSAGKVGVLESEDTDGTLGNTQGILQNNPGGAYGSPINGSGGKDGLIVATPASPTTLGFGGAGTPSEIFDQTAGGTFSVTNGAMSILGGGLGFGSNNTILLGQFTTDGDFSFELNIQLIKPGGSTADEYVASNPTSTETLFPGLIYPSVVTGVNKINDLSSSTITIYPNPAKDEFTFSIKDTKASANNSYSIYDVTGHLIANKDLGKISGDFSETVNIAQYSSGLYFLTLSLDGIKSTKKIIKE